MSAPLNPPNVGSGGKPPAPPRDTDNWLGSPPDANHDLIMIVAMVVLGVVASIAGMAAWFIILGACR